MTYGNQPPGGWGPPGGGWGPPPPNPYAAQPGTTGEFPADLVMAPVDRRVDETFGFFPAAFAIAALCGALGTIVTVILEGGFDDWNEIYLIAGGFAAALLFAFWEFWRRTHVTSLLVMNGRIAIYRKNVLDVVVTGGQMTWFRLNFSNSLREYILFGMCALTLPVGATQMFSARYMGMGLWMIGLGLGGCLAFASAIWARGMCLHYYIPKGTGTETVVLSKSRLRQLGNWPFPL